MPKLTDAQIDQIAHEMPGGLDGFLKGWGWRQYARAVEAMCEPFDAPPPAADAVSEAMVAAALEEWDQHEPGTDARAMRAAIAAALAAKEK